LPKKKVKKNFRCISDKDVYELLLRIPAGKVSTYGDIAKALGHPSAARAVGKVLNKNPNPIIVPCHRVIQSNGKLGGYCYGSEVKSKLLEKEGIKFQKDRTAKDFAIRRIILKTKYIL
jgi:methylated-DNA-[protein]-cysteine S-methyltransferase